MHTEERQTTGAETVHRNEALYEDSAMVHRYDTFGDDGWLTEREAGIVDEYFTEPGRVLDVGCGTGRTTRPLADRGHDVVGIDVSEGMVAQARARHQDLEFRVDDATDLGFADATFDYVLFSYYGLDSVFPAAERRRAMREVHRVLRPGGVFAFNSHNWWYVLPALVSDPGYLREYYLSNGNLRRLCSSYKRDASELDLDIYRGSPRRTRRQLADAGFDSVDVVSKRGGLLGRLEIQHHYVAEKS